MKAIELTAGILFTTTLASIAAAQCEPRLEAPQQYALQRFGWSSALTETWGFVGAQGDDAIAYNAGAVYTYERIGSTWVPRERLLADDGEERDLFGGSVAADGEWLVVGAPSNHAPLYRSGAAYVFQLQGGSWVQVQKLVASDAQESDEFGYAAAMDGDRLIIGARYGDAPGAADSGAAYIFELGSRGWTETAKVVASDAAPIDYFGRSVALDGELAVVGAFGNDDHGTGTGSAYVYRASTGWAEEQKLMAKDAANIDYFGFSVAVDGEVIGIGAPGWDGNFLDQGVVYVFRKQGSWFQDQYVPGVHSEGEFGYAIAMDSGEMVASAVSGAGRVSKAGDAATLVDNGSAFSFTGRLVASDGDTGDRYGHSVALRAGEVLVGAEADDDAGTFAGASYSYALPFLDTDLDGMPDDCAPEITEFCPCTTGPCGNSSAVGCANSAGAGAQLSFGSGGTSIADDDLVMSVSGLPASQFGIVFMGDAEVPGVFLADGLRCVGGNLFRFPVATTGALGEFDLGPGIVGHASNNFPAHGQIQPGQTWYFQAWYRDGGSTCGNGSNLSNGLAVSFK